MVYINNNVSPPKKYCQKVREPTPEPVVKRIFVRAPTPQPDIIERVRFIIKFHSKGLRIFFYNFFKL